MVAILTLTSIEAFRIIFTLLFYFKNQHTIDPKFFSHHFAIPYLKYRSFGHFKNAISTFFYTPYQYQKTIGFLMHSGGAKTSCHNISQGARDIFVKLRQNCKVMLKKIASDSLAAEIFCKKLETNGFIVAVLKTILIKFQKIFNEHISKVFHFLFHSWLCLMKLLWFSFSRVT